MIENLYGYSKEEVEKLILVDFENGKLFWKERSEDMFHTSPNPLKQCEWWNRSFAGNECGCVYDYNGVLYRRTNLNGKSVLNARVILFLHHSYNEPKLVVDHINGNSLDDRLLNLRFVSQHVNSLNKHNTKNKHGFTGVYYKNNKYFGKLKVKDTTYHTKGFKTAEEAHEAYLCKRLEVVNSLTSAFEVKQ